MSTNCLLFFVLRNQKKISYLEVCNFISFPPLLSVFVNCMVFIQERFCKYEPAGINENQVYKALTFFHLKGIYFTLKKLILCRLLLNYLHASTWLQEFLSSGIKLLRNRFRPLFCPAFSTNERKFSLPPHLIFLF